MGLIPILSVGSLHPVFQSEEGDRKWKIFAFVLVVNTNDDENKLDL